MADFTRKAIKEKFKQMLEERPLKEITVKELTKECGINRNSFYYHYQDIPALIEEMVKEHFDEVLAKYPDLNSIENGLTLAMEFTLSTRKALLHIYNSVNRDIFEKYLWDMCERGIRTYIETLVKDSNISEEGKEGLVRFHKSECFGLIMDWLNSGLDEKVLDSYKTITSLRNDQISYTIKQLENIK